ncbi:hypothetical protein AAG906_038073 [Vitis piasezkii]
MSIALAAVAGCEVLKEESGVSGAPDTGRKKVPSQKRESFSCKLFVKDLISTYTDPTSRRRSN